MFSLGVDTACYRFASGALFLNPRPLGSKGKNDSGRRSFKSGILCAFKSGLDFQASEVAAYMAKDGGAGTNEAKAQLKGWQAGKNASRKAVTSLGQLFR